MASPDFSKDSPFEPGSATIPAYVAGRKAEQQLIDEAIAAITKKRTKEGTLGSSPMTHITIIGPRGVGKTTLLEIADKKATEQEVFVVNSSRLDDLQGIIRKLVDSQGRKGWRRFVPRWLSRISNLGAQAGGAGLNIALNITLKDDPRQEDLELVLQERLQVQPVLLLMDEVMYYDLKSLGAVLQVSQFLIRKKMPLAVILAGTPDLESHLGKAQASFIARSQSLRINLFSDDEAADALRTPLANCGIETEAEALEMMVALADNYPFFVQMIGREVWKILVAKRQATVDIALVEAAGKAMQEPRNNFYRTIYAEMEELNLEAYAHQVVEIMDSFEGKRAEKKTIEAKLMSKNHKLSEEQARLIVKKLQQRGFLWAYEDNILGPGIPSFFTYVEEKKKRLPEQKPNEQPPS